MCTKHAGYFQIISIIFFQLQFIYFYKILASKKLCLRMCKLMIEIICFDQLIFLNNGLSASALKFPYINVLHINFY